MIQIAKHSDDMVKAWAKDLRTREPEIDADDYYKSFKKAREYTKYLVRWDEMFVRISTELVLKQGDWSSCPEIRDEIRDSLDIESRVTKDRVKILLKVQNLELPELIPAADTVDRTRGSIESMVKRSTK